MDENSDLSKSLAALSMEEDDDGEPREPTIKEKIAALEEELLETKRAAVFFRQQDLMKEAKEQLVEIRSLNQRIAELQNLLPPEERPQPVQPPITHAVSPPPVSTQIIAPSVQQILSTPLKENITENELKEIQSSMSSYSPPITKISPETSNVEEKEPEESEPIISIQLPEIKEEEKIVSAINPKPVIEPVIKIEESPVEEIKKEPSSPPQTGKSISEITKEAVALERKRAMMYTALETKLTAQAEKWKDKALVSLDLIISVIDFKVRGTYLNIIILGL